MSEVNASNCNHNCEGCQANCDERTQDIRAHLHPKSKVNKVIAIVSGKGGVGKSFVTGSLASEMARRNYRVGILDGDITGPSQAKIFGIHEKMYGDGELAYPAKSKNGIQIVSTNMMLDEEEAPVIWRGPILGGVIKQFYEEVYWENVDYMFVDMPPGTGDVPLTVFQSLPITGIIVVTSPQDLVSMVVSKAINMANMMNIPILGLVENMSYLECPNCKEKIEVFGKSTINATSEKYHLPVLARIPLRMENAAYCDEGRMDELEVEEIKDVADVIESLK